jgi:LAO/AO transport system kinase
VSDAALLTAALAGDRRALARVLSRVERGGAAAERIVDLVYPRAGDAHVVGVTGAPGAGKSTLVASLAVHLRTGGGTVAVVAVDPSSPFTGGALLGDRVRMGALFGDSGVFVRSMASRGAAGGLAEQTASTAAVLSAAGFDTVLVETVGVGQDELAVAQEAQTTVVVAAPGLGDEVQALKAGIVEIADVLVVNKADRDGADRLVADLRFGAGAGHVAHAAAGETERGWEVPVLKTVATTGEGMPRLAQALAQHRAWLRTSGNGLSRTQSLAARHIVRAAAARALRRAEVAARASGAFETLVRQVAARQLSPAAAAERLLQTSGAQE